MRKYAALLAAAACGAPGQERPDLAEWTGTLEIGVMDDGVFRALEEGGAAPVALGA